ncbi:MAG: FAD-dependent oxidoreductase [Clostridiales bacterium]|jgi:NADPH-dependent 2,4-dienoyl-CoA reductase/sulfur reductase-like enzyme|nr:FAD-dependent oxidoreductase [Clostridiales bacterium]MCI2161878.1 FAD-dependent oxidoreductase [Oscillospiraceae bacterium]MCI1962195.1 FAD-dependent oxidoreductase [Clostridiales bacterium]MCI2022637.1 FAD-dependent oxidoreductase [Clostridiales bacterium]MCI2027048.1 FAD-dependent oxidoreductase [Clostridiales bacterium]
MYEITCDVAVIGAGPAGLAAAATAKKQGAEKVLIIERDTALGGILQQCVHPGFGLSFFKEELTGPEYAGRFIEKVEQAGIQTLLDTMVLEVRQDGTIYCTNSHYGITMVKAKSVVLAMGCREKTRGNIQIPGTRPAGIYTAGSAQRMVNRQNEMVGKKVVILGSGDIGMIMARRLTLEGARVVAVVEVMDYLAGLIRNRVQCLDDFGIPLLLSHTVTRIVGNQRVEGVYVAKVDKNRIPILNTEEFFDCDTLLLSVGLIPENELSRAAKVEMDSVTNGPIVNQYMQTSAPSLFACGNVVHVNDLVDNVSAESMLAGKSAAKYAIGQLPFSKRVVKCQPGENVRYLCPQKIAVSDKAEDTMVYFRVKQPQKETTLKVSCDGGLLFEKRLPRVNPGEMQHVCVPIASLSGKTLTVDAEKRI